MVLLLFALQRADNTMKNTINDAEYIINWNFFIIIFQYVTNFRYSHSIVNEPFLLCIINDLLVDVGENTMKNTMLRNFFKKFHILI